MKKIFCILSILTITMPCTVWAEDEPTPTPSPVAGSPTSYLENPTGDSLTAVLGGDPLYQLMLSNTGTDGNAASAGYVKGAYNASIKAINKVAQVAGSKQAILTSSNVTTTGTGGVVTGVTASNGAVAVTKANVTIPVGSTTASDQAGVYVD